MTPHRLTGAEEAAEVLDLIRAAFAFMDGRIDPPSSVYGLDVAAILAQDRQGEVWVTGRPPLACVFLTPRQGALYLGKLAVRADRRRGGLARDLTDLACRRAKALGLPAVELQTRVELTENHLAFRALGFVETGRSAHPGFDRPTTLTFRRAVC